MINLDRSCFTYSHKERRVSSNPLHFGSRKALANSSPSTCSSRDFFPHKRTPQHRRRRRLRLLHLTADTRDQYHNTFCLTLNCHKWSTTLVRPTSVVFLIKLDLTLEMEYNTFYPFQNKHKIHQHIQIDKMLCPLKIIKWARLTSWPIDF